MFVDISAKQGTNIDKLLEAVLLTADAQPLTCGANPDTDARGATVEVGLIRGAAQFTALVQQGTLHVGDTVVAGAMAACA